jgi:DNA-binding MurR/RpiR family transcriptional regulator
MTGNDPVSLVSVDARIRGMLPALTATERKVAETVLADPVLAAASTISELASRSGTSNAAVTRFCRAIDLTGYSQLRLLLAAEAGREQSRSHGAAGWHTWSTDISSRIGPTDPLEQVLAGLVDIDSRALEQTAAQLEVAAVEKAVGLLAKARRIDIYAVSGGAAAGLDMQLRLHHIGKVAFLWNDVHDAVASAALLAPADAALAITHSGETREVNEPLALARERGAATIAITSFPRSAAARAADITLLTRVRETPFRPGTMSARHAQMLLLDCLYIGIAQREYSTATRALEEVTDAVRAHRDG